MLARRLEEEEERVLQRGGALRAGRERVLCGHICREALDSSSPTRCLLRASWGGCGLATFFLFFCLFRELALLLCGRCSVGQVVFLCACLLLGGRKKAWINAKLWTGRGG